MVSKPLQIADRPFWWVGPRGGRALVWHTDWRKGWYGAGHVLGMPQGMEVLGPRLLEYLRLLESEGYPYQPLLLHYAADNYPPSASVADLVQTWNDEVGEPRLRLSTNRTFFERLIELHGDDFPTHQLAWPDWWSEGIGSAAYESALSRETHCRLRRIEALQAKLGDTRDLWPIWEDLLLFDEHTWGCSNMGVAPHSYHSRASWVHKARHIYLAHDRARRLEAELAQALAPVSGEQQAEDFRDQTVREQVGSASRLSLFNPLAAEFHGSVELPGLKPADTKLRRASGEVLVQHSVPTALRPRRSVAALALEPGEAESVAAVADLDVFGATQVVFEETPAPGLKEPGLLDFEDNEFFELQFDENGRLFSLVDKSRDVQMLDARAPWGFGEVIRETITSPEDRAAVWERGYTELPYAYRRSDANFAREGSLANSRVVRVESGPVFDALIVASELPYLRRIETELRLWRELPWLEVEVRLDKQAYENYEGVYVAFPFKLEGARALVHSCDAVFEAQTQQLPGTCRDYYAVQDYAAMVNDEGWAAVCPVEAPLMQLGAITFGRWADHLRLDRACLYSWLTNNFWYTNFPGYQLGELTFRFAVAVGGGEFDPEHVQRLADATRVGLSVAVVE